MQATTKDVCVFRVFVFRSLFFSSFDWIGSKAGMKRKRPLCLLLLAREDSLDSLIILIVRIELTASSENCLPRLTNSGLIESWRLYNEPVSYVRHEQYSYEYGTKQHDLRSHNDR